MFKISAYTLNLVSEAVVALRKLFTTWFSLEKNVRASLSLFNINPSIPHGIYRKNSSIDSAYSGGKLTVTNM